jgi:hypothetical protein
VRRNLFKNGILLSNMAQIELYLQDVLLILFFNSIAKVVVHLVLISMVTMYVYLSVRMY